MLYENVPASIIGGGTGRAPAPTSTSTQLARLALATDALSDADLKGMTQQFQGRLAKGETLDDLLEEAFAVVREASKRVRRRGRAPMCRPSAPGLPGCPTRGRRQRQRGPAPPKSPRPRPPQRAR
jgi:hypothetical protein